MGPRPWKLLRGTTTPLIRWSATRLQWNIVGRDLPDQAAKAAASYQLTPVTGRSSCPSTKFPDSHVAGPAAGRVAETRHRLIEGEGAIAVHEWALPVLALPVAARVDEALELGVGHLVTIDPEIAEAVRRQMIEAHDQRDLRLVASTDAHHSSGRLFRCMETRKDIRRTEGRSLQRRWR